MSNIEGLNTPDPKALYAEYKFEDSSYRDPARTRPDGTMASFYMPVENDSVFTRAYYVPLDSVRNTVALAEDVTYNTLKIIEDNLLRRIYIDPFIDPDLEQAHFRVWTELSKKIFTSQDKVIPPHTSLTPDLLLFANPNSSAESDAAADWDANYIDANRIASGRPLIPEQVSKETPPDYICLDEIIFAEKSMSTACRILLQEYNEATALSTFSYFYQLRKILELLLHELACIKQSLLYDFGAQYENESQQQIALQYDAWAKAALHYSGRVTKIISTQTQRIPSSEVDQVSKKQATQFQAFFTVRLNAVNSEINDIVSSLKRDLVDNCEIFYERYLAPALSMAKDVSDPLELDFITTQFQRENPVLSGELLAATNTLKGNFASIHADLIDRHRTISDKIDGALNLLYEKKRYSNFISQLGNKAVGKKRILQTVDNDIYSQFFRSAPIDASSKSSLVSSHSNLDGLEEDSHPQYLLRDGGTIVGNINVDEGITIDGVDLSTHRHTGADGSPKISALDIDYSSARENPSNVSSPLSVRVENFIPDIIDGGIPVFDTIIAIEVEDEGLDGYEYEILFTEIES